jgi:hypothetical protein
MTYYLHGTCNAMKYALSDHETNGAFNPSAAESSALRRFRLRPVLYVDIFGLSVLLSHSSPHQYFMPILATWVHCILAEIILTFFSFSFLSVFLELESLRTLHMLRHCRSRTEA